MYQIDMSNMKLNLLRNITNEYCSLSVWGGYFVEEIPENFRLSGIDTESIQSLNLDGGYVAVYENKKKDCTIVFRGNVDNFNLYYTMEGNILFFSDDFYSLCKYHKKLTYNLNSISDYFETGWNNINKYDRSPLKEIKRLDLCTYLILNGENLEVHNWNTIQRTVRYDLSNLKEFEDAFYETLDYYLNRFHTNEKVGISVSAGLDSNTIAARYSQLFPYAPAFFYTSKIDDETDESVMASNMRSVITSDIHEIELTAGELDIIGELTAYEKSYTPPRFFNELCEKKIFRKTIDLAGTEVFLNGMGSDVLFGGFAGEYMYLMLDYLKQGKIEEAKKVFKARLVSFPDKKFSYEKRRFSSDFSRYSDYLMTKAEKTGSEKYVNPLLNIALPKQMSQYVGNYTDALAYASYDGATRSTSTVFRDLGVELWFPYEGYRFYKLGMQCDPIIFCNGVNKYCVRYSTRNILPKEIVNFKVKKGNPGVTLQKVFQQSGNQQKILDYICNRNLHSGLVNEEKLKGNVEQDVFGRNEFLALSLLVFEDTIMEKFGVNIII